jgi:hypothetical protein
MGAPGATSPSRALLTEPFAADRPGMIPSATLDATARGEVASSGPLDLDFGTPYSDDLFVDLESPSLSTLGITSWRRGTGPAFL